MLNNTTAVITSNNSTMLITSNPIVISIGDIVVGVIIVLLGQIVIKFILNPIVEQHDIINEIKCALIYYADIIDNPGTNGVDDKINDGKKRLRHLSSLLRAKTSRIPLYKYLEVTKFAKKREDIQKISENLVGIANLLDNEKYRDKINEWNDEISEILYPNKNKAKNENN